MNMNHCISLVFKLTTAIILICSANTATAKDKNEKQIWAFAYGTCLNDSTVYVSAISTIPHATLDKKTQFLTNRAAYTAQFQQYLKQFASDNRGIPATCAIFFDTKKSRLEKKFAKMRQRAKKITDKKWTELNAGDFKWEPITEE